MKVLLSWMQEFAPGITGDPVELGEKLSSLGLAVEEMTLLGGGLDGIVVAKVLETRPHPDADRIQLVDVDLGDGEPLQIACGAFNMAAGDLVPLATLGTVMADGMEIARRKMRGEWSNGMLCSPTEIGLNEASTGIKILEPGLPLGTPIAEALSIVPDVLYDLEVNPNRPDAMSIAGVARDLAAALGVPFSLPKVTITEGGEAAGSRASVKVLDPDLCGRFAARVVDGVKVGPSPMWMANRLMALGMRSINNVVDVSNYVMLELGIPNHAYDLDLVAGHELRVRKAADGETIVTLDDQDRTLTSADGVIADGNDVAVGIAGVMGGASTEISESTSSVLVEAAWWHPMTIAKSSRRLGLRSEASSRFERGTDPGQIDRALDRFVELLEGAQAAPGVVDDLGHLPVPAQIRVRTARVNALLGTSLSAPEIRDYLTSIEFDVTAVGADTDVTVPSFRPDTTIEVDCIEEVARLYGYERIGKQVPRSPLTGHLTANQIDRRQLRSTLVGLGFDEAMPVPFLAPGDLDRAGLDSNLGITVTNPLVAAESIMRTSLRPGLLKAVAHNVSHRLNDVRLFEIGHVFAIPSSEAPLPDERNTVGVAIAGAEAPEAVRVWSAVASSLGFSGDQLIADEPAGMHPTRTARIEIDGTPVGLVGEIDPYVVESYGAGTRVAWLELDLDTLLALPHAAAIYKPVSRYPSSDVDLAFEVDEAVPAAAVEATMRDAGGELLAGLSLFDVYRGDRVAPDHRSLAWTVRLQADDRTLTDADVAEVRQQLIDAVEAGHPAQLRR